MTKKITYTQALVNAIAVVEDVATRERLEDLRISLEKKASAKRKAVDNSPYFELVENALDGKSLTPTELVKIIGVDNTQKVSAIVSKMPNVVKTTKGKKVFYSLA